MTIFWTIWLVVDGFLDDIIGTTMYILNPIKLNFGNHEWTQDTHRDINIQDI